MRPSPTNSEVGANYQRAVLRAPVTGFILKSVPCGCFTNLRRGESIPRRQWRDE